MSELLPCPFCGGEAKIDHLQAYMTLRAHSKLDTRTAIYCIECIADMGFCHADLDGEQIKPATEHLIAAWNTRTPPHNNQKEADRG